MRKVLPLPVGHRVVSCVPPRLLAMFSKLRPSAAISSLSGVSVRFMSSSQEFKLAVPFAAHRASLPRPPKPAMFTRSPLCSVRWPHGDNRHRHQG